MSRPFDPSAPLPFKSLKSLETVLNLEDVPIEQTSEKSEEIENFTMEEGLDELQRAEFILRKGHIRQKMSVCLTMASLVREHGEDETHEVLELLMDFAQSKEAQQEHLLAVADSVHSLALVASHSFFRHLLPTLLALAETDDKEVAQKFRDLCVELVERVLNDELLRDEIIPFANARVGLGKKAHSRMLSAVLFGSLAKRLSPSCVQREILAKALTLCQDMESEVRCTMARQLKFLAACVGKEKSAEVLLPELLELLKDNDSMVKGEAIKEAVEMMDFLDRDSCKSALLPTLLALGVGVPRPLKLTLATIIGPLLVKCKSFLREDNINVFLDAFRELARRGDPDTRFQCAFNFPAVISVAGEARYSSHLHALHEFFAGDAEERVRRSVAASLHEIALLISTRSVEEFLRPIFDDQLTVTDALMPNIGNLLRSLTSLSGGEGGSSGSSSSLSGVGSSALLRSPRSSLSPRRRSNSINNQDKIVSCILEYEGRARSNWRLLVNFLEGFRAFSKYMSVEVLSERLIPLAFKHLSTLSNPLPVQKAAATATMHLIRAGKLGVRRYEFCERLVEEFAEGKGHKLREVYLLVCHAAYQLFSRQFFLQHFLTAALSLWRDPVANVRIKVCRLLPTMKMVLKPPTDLSLASRLNESLSHLLLDRDPDVVEAAQQAQAAMKELEDEFSRESRYGMKSEEDEADRRKEEEEKRLFQGEEERLRKIRRETERLTGSGAGGASRRTTGGSRPGLPPSRGSAGSFGQLRGGGGSKDRPGRHSHTGKGAAGRGGTGSGSVATPSSGSSLLSVEVLTGGSSGASHLTSSLSDGVRSGSGMALSRSPGRRSASPNRKRSGGTSSSSSSSSGGVSSNVAALSLHSSPSAVAGKRGGGGGVASGPRGRHLSKSPSPSPSPGTSSSSGASRFVPPSSSTTVPAALGGRRPGGSSSAVRKGSR